jgi:hypothetical protein
MSTTASTPASRGRRPYRVGPETLRKWAGQAEIDADERDEVTTATDREYRKLRARADQCYLGWDRLFSRVSWLFPSWTVSVTWMVAMRLARSCPCMSAR